MLNASMKVCQDSKNLGQSKKKGFLLPLYFQEYVNRHLSEEDKQEHLLQFHNLVVEKVIESEWVLGVKDYLLSNSEIQHFFLLTGIPQDEMLNFTITKQIILYT